MEIKAENKNKISESFSSARMRMRNLNEKNIYFEKEWLVLERENSLRDAAGGVETNEGHSRQFNSGLQPSQTQSAGDVPAKVGVGMWVALSVPRNLLKFVKHLKETPKDRPLSS